MGKNDELLSKKRKEKRRKNFFVGNPTDLIKLTNFIKKAEEEINQETIEQKIQEHQDCVRK